MQACPDVDSCVGIGNLLKSQIQPKIQGRDLEAQEVDFQFQESGVVVGVASFQGGHVGQVWRPGAQAPLVPDGLDRPRPRGWQDKGL